MKTITQNIRTHAVWYTVFAVVIAVIAFFAVMPFIADMKADPEAPTMAARLVSAWDDTFMPSLAIVSSGGSASASASASSASSASVSTTGSGVTVAASAGAASDASAAVTGGGSASAEAASAADATASAQAGGTGTGTGGAAVADASAVAAASVSTGGESQTVIHEVTSTTGNATAHANASASVSQTTQTSVTGQCVLEISKVASKSSVKPGDTITYTITFKNTGTADCTGGGVKVVDQLDSNLTYQSETHSANVSAGYNGTVPTYNASDRTVNWNADTLTPGESGQVTVTATVNTPAQCGNRTIENKAKITAYELNNFTTWVTSNTVVTTLQHECAPNAPVCTLDVSPATINQGGSTMLTWTTQNATAVSIDQGVGSVAANGSKPHFPTQNTTYTLTATGPGGTVTCVKPVTVVLPSGQCALEITKEASKQSVKPGDMITYTIKFKNIGTADCTGGGVKVVDQLDSNLTYQSETHSDNVSEGYNGMVPTYNPSDRTVNWNAHTLTPGESGWVTVTAKVNTPAQCGNRTISNTAKMTAYELNYFNTWITSNTVVTTLQNECGPNAPVCTLSGSPTSVNQGGSATLTWTTQNATAVSIDQGVGSVGTNGTKAVTPAQTTTYTLTATGPGGTVTCAQTITVVPPVTPVPVCTLDAAPSSVNPGGSATLTWTTQNATAVSIDQGVGSVGTNGTKAVTPAQTTTYTLTATGQGGTVTCVKTVTVETPQPLTCDAFTANPGTLAAAGTTTLAWATTNATAVSIDQGIGAVPVDGSQAVYVASDKTFTLTATRGSETKTCTVPVKIQSNVVVPKCDSFTVSPTSVRSGDSVTLAWQTTDATQVTIDNGIGSVALDGSQSVNVPNDTTYVLTATNGSASATCQVSVDVESGGGGGGSSSPRCSLTASDTKIKPGEKVTLTWKNTRTNDIVLKDNRGNELIDTTEAADDKKYNEDNDSIEVRPTKSTSYTMTVYKGSKKRECTVDVNVESVTVTSTRTRDPLVAGISLSRVPYTGFEAGPLLTSIFYTILVVWAFGVAYFLVMRRAQVVTPTGVNTRMVPPLSTIAPDMVPRARAEEPVVVASLPNVATVDAPRGYEAYAPFTVAPVAPAIVTAIDMDALEVRAQESRVLMSTDALRFIEAQSVTQAEAVELLDMVIAAAKASFPKEDGWVVVNKEKIMSLLK